MIPLMDPTQPRRSPARSRRNLLLLGLAATLPVPRAWISRAWIPRAWAEDENTRATAFIRDTGLELGRIARAAPAAAARRAALKPFLDRVVDWSDLARFCLGRFWTQADPAHRQRFQALFETVILLNVLNRLNTYQSGESRVVVGHANATGDGYEVPTTVQSGNDPAVRITWRVAFVAGTPRIVDVSAEGISLRVTLRSDFGSYLRQNGDSLDALFGAMQRMIAGL